MNEHVGFPHKKPEKAPDHPFWNCEYRDNHLPTALVPGFVFAMWLFSKCMENQQYMKPEEVTGHFDHFLTLLGRNTVECNLSDVRNVLSWFADVNAHFNRPFDDPKRMPAVAEGMFDQLAALVEQAVNLKDH